MLRLFYLCKQKKRMTHKAGFVNIVGNPNVGKSTLMNALVGERISIITSKAQTTRHRIMGIVNGEDFQIVYSDTPGILKPNYKLQESMLKYSTSALSDADVIVYVTDVKESPEKFPDFIERIKEKDSPVMLVINKIDLTSPEELDLLFDKWKEIFPKAEIFPVSALHSFNLESLLNRVKGLLPDSPPFFDKDALTDKPSRFFVTEIIREKILLKYDQEIPYAVEVVVQAFQDEESLIRIDAEIYCERPTQKGIIIGHKGAALKWVGTEARKEMEAFFGKKVFLQVHVKVEKDWRDNDYSLRNFGYGQ